ncbi:MAG: hypothetical protein WCR51_05545 [Planctomycetia bacterium]
MSMRLRRALRVVRHAALMAACLAASPARAADGVAVRVELDDGTAREGTLVEIAAADLRVAGVDGTAASIPLERVRTVGRSAAPPAAPRGRVRVMLTDDTSLVGDEFSWSGDAATLGGPTGRIELPLSRIRAVEWRPGDEAVSASWVDAVPEGTTSDLVVIGKPDGFEFVECAISAIGPDSVTVVLDDETIPVKRSKVVGLRWLRGDAALPIGRTLVDVDGGSLRADTVAWTATGLRLDDTAADRRIVMPAEALRRIDYAAGRTTLLTTVAPERLEVEPFFGALGRIEGLAASFAPRPVAADARHAKPGLVVRPRTVAVWRIPPGARRFRSAVTRDAGVAPALVTITVDDRRVFEQVVSGEEPAQVVLDVAGGRRLGITVDFGPAGAMAGAVRFEEPAIEQ